tara:strand:+ start:588 stop:1181 length:594 start_codon:yes stop_codon:yes gene_type:complete
MANMMKIKINSTTTPLKVGAAINLTDAGTSSTPGTYAAAAFTNSGSGTGAVITVVIGAGGNATSATVTAGGDSYEANDVLTFSAIPGGDVVVATVAAADLDVDSSLGSVAYVPVDDVVCVIPTGDGSLINIHQLQDEHDRKWELTLNGGDTSNTYDVAVAVNNCIISAQRAPLSKPILGSDEFPLPDKVTISKAELA